MKKILCVIPWLALCSLAASAQDKPDSNLRKTAISICNCLEKNNIEKVSTETEMQQIFLQCMFDSAGSAISDIVGNSDNGDYKSAGEAFGQKIAMELMNTGCQPFIKMSIKLAQNNPGNDDIESISTKTADGTVIKTEEKDFLYITVKTTAGREITLIYLDYIDNSDDWVKDAAVKLKDKKVSVQWTEKEVYQPKIKEFSNVKILKSLSINTHL